MMKQRGFDRESSADCSLILKKNKPFKDTLVKLDIPRHKRIKKISSHSIRSESRLSSADSTPTNKLNSLRKKLKEMRDINTKIDQGNEQLRVEWENQRSEMQSSFENLIRLLFIVSYHHDKKLFNIINEFLQRKNFVTYPERLSLNIRNISRIAKSFIFHDCDEPFVQNAILTELKQSLLSHLEGKGNQYNSIMELFTFKRIEEGERSNSSKKEPKFLYLEIESLSEHDLKTDQQNLNEDK
jgi:hypothetical protein